MSAIAEQVHTDSHSRGPTRHKHTRFGINRDFLHLCRTIHIYLTMTGLGVMLLFGITGFTVNHEDWFNATTPRVTELQGQTPTDLVKKMDRLAIVEHLRSTFHITGAMTGFEDLDEKLSIGFKKPDTLWEIEINKSTGATSVHIETFNFTALINNLHRGRYAGPAWKWVIDISAGLIVIACFTGVVLWMVLPKRRKYGIAAMFFGTIGTILIYAWLVPGPDQQRDLPPEAPAVAAESQ